MNNKSHAVIVGGGASGICVFIALVLSKKIDEITIIGKKRIGYSEAFSESSDSMICNTSVASISVVPRKQHDFYNYLKENGFDYNLSDFTPRHLVDKYILGRFNQYRDMFLNMGMNFNYIDGKCEYISISNFGYEIKVENNNSVFSNIVFVCTGYSSRCYPKSHDMLIHNESYFRSPYPISNITSRLEVNSRVLILGTKLSAIETAIHLNELGHTVTMCSPSGEIPAVRTHTNPSTKNILNRSDFSKLDYSSESIFDDLIKIIDESLIGYFNCSIHEQVAESTSLLPRLEEEVLLAESNKIHWQEIFVEFIDIVNELLMTQDVDVKKNFMSKFISNVERYFGACSLESSRVLLSNIRQGLIEIRKGEPALRTSEDGKWYAGWEGIEERFDSVIVAMGRNYPEHIMYQGKMYIDNQDHSVSHKGTLPHITRDLRVYNNQKEREENIWLVGIGSYPHVPLVNAIYPFMHQADSIRKWFERNE